MIKTKKQMFIVIGAFLLTILLGTVTYAFFNYTRTGTANTIKTGRIAFNAEQGDRVTLDGLFPITTTGEVTANTPGVGSLSIHVTGDTTYNEGIEYIVKAVNVTGSNGTELPISIKISYEANNNKTIGTVDADYFDNRGGNTSLYKVLSTSTIEDNGDLVVGYIAPGQTGIDGNIVIMAWLDAANIAITDTTPYEQTDTNNDGYLDGTIDAWVNGRTVFTTEEWNALTANGVSFQVKVEANEGIWVEEPGITINYVDETGIVNPNSKRLSLDATTYGSLPVLEHENPMYLFEGWYTEANGGVEVKSYDSFVNGTSPTTLYAHWIDMCPNCVYGTIFVISSSLSSDTYTSWNTVNHSPSIINNESIKTLDEVKNYGWFVGMVLDENTNALDRAYLCGHGTNDRIFCVEAHNNDSDKFAINSRILENTIGNKTTTTSHAYYDEMYRIDVDNAVEVSYSGGINFESYYEGYYENLTASNNGTLFHYMPG